MKIEEVKIKFVGKVRTFDRKTGKEKLVIGTAPQIRRNGNLIIELPPDAVQKKGFTHTYADFLLKNYPREYKTVTSKRKGK